jgi:hypothetical protein
VEHIAVRPTGVPPEDGVSGKEVESRRAFWIAEDARDSACSRR